jgi:hypothetical protein
MANGLPQLAAALARYFEGSVRVDLSSIRLDIPNILVSFFSAVSLQFLGNVGRTRD